MLYARLLIAAFILLAILFAVQTASDRAASAAGESAAQTAPDRSSGTRERESAAQISPATAADAADSARAEAKPAASVEALARDAGQQLVIVPAEGGLKMHGIRLPRFSGLPAPVCYICDEQPESARPPPAHDSDHNEAAQ